MGRKKKENYTPPERFLVQGWFRLDLAEDKAAAEYFQAYMTQRGVDSQKPAIYDAIVALSSCQAAEINDPSIMLPPRAIDRQIKEDTEYSLQKLYAAISQLTTLIRDGVLIAAHSGSQQQINDLADQVESELSDLESSAVGMFTPYTFEDDEDD